MNDKIKIYFECNERHKEKKLYKEIQEVIKQQKATSGEIKEVFQVIDSPELCDYICPTGGDGSMLGAVKKYYHLGKPFLGINLGDLGYLLNDIDSIDQIPGQLEGLYIKKAPLVPVVMIDKHGKRHSSLFFNDVVLGNGIENYYNFNVQSEKGGRANFNGTGLIVNTVFGATAYGAGLGQQVPPIDSDVYGVVGCGARPFHFRHFEAQHIRITPERIRSQGFKAFIDGEGEVYEDIREVIVYPYTKTATLCFLNEKDFQRKRLKLSEDKLGISWGFRENEEFEMPEPFEIDDHK